MIEKIANSRKSHSVLMLVTFFSYLYSILYLKLFFISDFRAFLCNEECQITLFFKKGMEYYYLLQTIMKFI